ncbi:MAG: hypothetical protein KA313_09890 [Pseudarcicella sp.]|nr:hypothetical protein [Pseudarcicella sp.]MBP6411399.1 hypothetical protein [Pseudarcicella sp.]
MKNTITILLALLIFLQPLSKIGIYVVFKANQGTIAKTLCQKRFNKNNSCKGQCVLMKKIAQAEKEDQKNNSENNKSKSEVLFCQKLDFIQFKKNELLGFLKNKNIFSGLIEPNISEEIFGIFHPPQAV